MASDTGNKIKCETDSEETIHTESIRRPHPVTFIGGLLIFLGLFKLLNYAMVFLSSSAEDFFESFIMLSDDPYLSLLMSFVATAVLLLGGLFILKGWNIARYVVVIWMALVLMINAASGLAWSLLVIRVAVWVILAAGLFYPAASQFFKATPKTS